MADPQNTPSQHKPAIKPEQYAPPAIATPPKVERDDQSAAAKTGRAAAMRADQQVPRITAVTVTIDADSGDIVRIEGLDSTGARRELSDEEKKSLRKEGRSDERLAALVEQAFEAGIACVLGDVGDAEEEAAEESPEDAELRRMLLAPLIERSAVGHLMERAALNRAILGTLLEHSTK
jgi:hypothetical protein